jgi:hypothetical protein
MAAEIGGVALIPELGELPSTDAALQVFYDTLYHSAAVVSIGSSGFINALIAGKPSATVLVDYYSHLQAEAPHFRHLIESGALAIGKDFSAIPEFLEAVLDGREDRKLFRRRFIAEFIRPQGVGISAGAVVAEALERLTSKA